MEIIYKKQIISRNNNEFCQVTEFPLIDNEINFAIVKLSGRYPDKNFATNIKCKEMVYVHLGNGKVVINDHEYLLNSGDLVLIEAGETFYWEGNMELHISCTPAFTIEQHQLTDYESKRSNLDNAKGQLC